MTIRTYREFWPFYLRQHADARTRAVHYLGASSLMACLAAAIVTGQAWYVLAGFGLFYLPAWVAHFVIEGNRPATWTYPVWSFVSDLRMGALWLSGRLGPELQRAQALAPAAAPGLAAAGPR